MLKVGDRVVFVPKDRLPEHLRKNDDYAEFVKNSDPRGPFIVEELMAHYKIVRLKRIGSTKCYNGWWVPIGCFELEDWLEAIPLG